MHSIIPYQDQDTQLEGFVAYPNQTVSKRPVVILCHAWRGNDPFICEKAKEIAEWGYIGFALDIYGKGVLGQTKEENVALKKPWMENRIALQRRLLKSYEVASHLPHADPKNIAALGFGFGGMCALDLARSGVPLKGAVSIYGHFDPPPKEYTQPIHAKILILHGAQDTITTREELNRFENQLNVAQVDWQAQIYGGTLHAFATPGVNDPVSGVLYNPISAARAWQASRDFFDEIF